MCVVIDRAVYEVWKILEDILLSVNFPCGGTFGTPCRKASSVVIVPQTTIVFTKKESSQV